jgi:glycosyltransferase involved in cell wall biosynthesis
MRISVITVVFNNKEHITGAIGSVLSQDYPSIEYVIVDGGSTDGTIDAIEKYRDKISVFISEPDDGIYSAMNKGLKLSTCEVIGILNSDDFYPTDDVLTEVAKVFEQNPDVDMVLGNVDFVSPDNIDSPVRFYSSFNFAPWKMRFGFMPAHPATFIRRTAYEKVGQYKENYKIAADFEFFVRAFLVKKCSFAKVDNTLVRMREGGASTSGLKSYWVITKEELMALRDNGIYSNLLFVLLRLPIKYSQKVFHKWRRGD